MKDYIVVKEREIKDLESKVDLKRGEGYCLVGGVSTFIANGNSSYYLQALEKIAK